MTVSALLFLASLGYLALIFFRPWDVVPGWEDLHLVLGASAILTPLLVIEWRRRRSLPLELPHDRLLLAYGAIIGLSNVASGWTAGIQLGLLQFAQLAFLYFVLRTAVTTPARLRAVIVVLAAAMLFHAVGAIVQYQLGVGWGGVPIYTIGRSWRSRSVGIFNDPNDLALGFLLVLPFLAAWALGARLIPRYRAMAASTAFPILLAFYYTESRGALLGLVASVCVYVWRRFGRTRGVAIAAIVVAALLVVVPTRVARQLTSKEPSAEGRIRAWAAGLDMIKQRPVLGVGWDRFTVYHERPAHNTFLHASAELGLLGGTCFVAIVYSFFWGLSSRSGTDQPGELSGDADALSSAGAGFFVAAFFLSKQYNTMTFTLIALGASHLAMVDPGRFGAARRFGARQWLVVAAVNVAILLAVWLSVRFLA